MTFTSSPPRRREERQQSIAVLPPPSTITRLPILLMWPNETDGQPVDADMDVGGGFLAAGDVEVAAARRAGADEDRVVALGEQRLQAVDALAADELDAEVEDVADLLVDHRLGQAEARDLRADHAAGLGVVVEDDARRSRAARGRARPSARPGRRRPARCACRSCRRRASAGGRGCRPCCRRRRASGGRSRPAPSRRARAGRPARRGGRRCGRGSRGTRSTSS